MIPIPLHTNYENEKKIIDHYAYHMRNCLLYTLYPVWSIYFFFPKKKKKRKKEKIISKI